VKSVISQIVATTTATMNSRSLRRVRSRCRGHLGGLLEPDRIGGRQRPLRTSLYMRCCSPSA